MRSPKVFIVLLFVVGILFVVGLNLGALHNDDLSVQTPAWVNNLGGVLVKQQPLKVGEISPAPASCLQKGTIVVSVSQSCTFTIQQSFFTTRSISVHLMQGNSAIVKLTQESSLPLQQSLAKAQTTPASSWKIYAGKTQGRLSITCLNAQDAPACLLILE